MIEYCMPITLRWLLSPGLMEQIRPHWNSQQTEENEALPDTRHTASRVSVMSSDVSLLSIEVDGWVANVLWRSSNVSRAWCDIHISQRLVFLAFSLRMIFMAHISIWWDEDFLNSGKGVTWTGCHGKKPAHIGVCCQLIYLLRPTKCYLKALSVLLRVCVWIQLELDEVVCRKLEDSDK